MVGIYYWRSTVYTDSNINTLKICNLCPAASETFALAGNTYSTIIDTPGNDE